MQPPRNHALDLLRGLTIALMIVVNNPGDWKQMFAVLKHAEWDGFLGADIVFPLFLFVSGFAAALKIDRIIFKGVVNHPLNNPQHYFVHLIRRAAILFLIGLFLNAWPFGILPGTEFSPSQLRVWGVLQRIAVCVLVGGLILYKVKSVRGTIFALIVLATLYEIGMRVPLIQTAEGNFGRSFALADNFARYVDISVLPSAMLYKVQKIPFDPEGIFTSLTAVMSFLIGGLCFRLRENLPPEGGYKKSNPLPASPYAPLAGGEFSEQNTPPYQGGMARRAGVVLFRPPRAQGGVGFCYAAVLTLLGIITALVEPVNKNLWTLPYTLLTGCAGVILLTLLEKINFGAGGWLSRITVPIADMGRNPLVIYILSGIFGKALALTKMASGMSLKAVLFSLTAFLPVSGRVASLLYSLVLLILMATFAHFMRRSIRV